MSRDSVNDGQKDKQCARLLKDSRKRMEYGKTAGRYGKERVKPIGRSPISGGSMDMAL